MTLRDRIIARVQRLGPLSVAEYMAQCLYDPEGGYYTTARPIGASGDFITAPEVSQMFGEMVGLWLAQVWMDQGRPDPFVLAELGPGTGQMMADVLRATRGVPGFSQAARVVLVEISPELRERQQAAIGTQDVTWVNRLEDVPPGPLFLLANEFFDCLPVHQYLRTPDGWQERVVAVVDGALTFARRPAGAVGRQLPADWPEGRVLELCPAATALAHEIAGRVAGGGAALIVDYGGTGEGGDTLQAVRAHQKVDPLATPGQADLTAHVDFAALAGAAEKEAAVFGPIPQGLWLERLGITQRAQALAGGLKGDALDAHVAAHRRLTHPDEMGDLFKAIAFLPRGAALPPGFGP